MMTYRQIAEEAKVSERTVKRWASKRTPAYRRLKVVRFGHSTARVREDDWWRFLEANSR